jgi:ADP-dependent NAD(P)H-hydrate dehydratase / NAD(P)H-hydrate epimerase
MEKCKVSLKIVDSKTMSSIDILAQTKYSIPSQILMENAGIKAYNICRNLMDAFSDPQAELLFLAGTGNNGGDALVMARQACMDGLSAKVLLLGPVKSPTAALNLEIIENLGVNTVSFPDQPEESLRLLHSAAVIVDGLFGIGISGPLREEAAALVDEINSCAGQVISLDVPSGLGDGFKADYPIVHASVTLCLGLPKASLYVLSARARCGRIVHVPIGFPPALTKDSAIKGELLEYDDIEILSVSTPPDAHKGSRGKLAVFAGSTGMTGAPVLAAQSAARSRCGLVSLFIEENAYQTVSPNLISVMAKPWDVSGDPASFDFDAFDACLVGPGWGFDGRLAWLKRIIDQKHPRVLDADALTMLSGIDGHHDLGGNAVLTPHPGEMARLVDMSVVEVTDDPVACAAKAARLYNAVVVLKGHITTVCEPGGGFWIFDGMNPALGTGGSGDVLAGVIAGLLAGGIAVREAACLGVLAHGKAGERAFAERGWFLAEDLPPYISVILAGMA